MKLEELAKIEVGGNFLRFDNGFEFAFQIVNFEPEEVEKEYQGKKSTKFQWKILLKDITVINKKITDYIQEVNPDKYKKILAQELNKSIVLELPKTASKELAIFCLENQTKVSDQVKMTRTGEKSNTKYLFNKKELRENNEIEN